MCAAKARIPAVHISSVVLRPCTASNVLICIIAGNVPLEIEVLEGYPISWLFWIWNGLLKMVWLIPSVTWVNDP